MKLYSIKKDYSKESNEVRKAIISSMGVLFVTAQ